MKIGDSVSFKFNITNNGKQSCVVRIEYGIYYLRQNGSHTKKVFKISERIVDAGEKLEFVRKQSFRVITTRKFYCGEHKLSVIINGREQAISTFELF